MTASSGTAASGRADATGPAMRWSTPMPLPRAYLASPLGFAGSTQAFMVELETALATLVTVDNPWRLDKIAAEEFAAADAHRDRHDHERDRRGPDRHRRADRGGIL